MIKTIFLWCSYLAIENGRKSKERHSNHTNEKLPWSEEVRELLLKSVSCWFNFWILRFYKNPDKPGTVVHIGTVIEVPSEYKSSRLTKRERKQSVLEEIMSDDSIKNYSKRVFNTIQEQKSNKRRVYKASKKDKKPKKVRSLY